MALFDHLSDKDVFVEFYRVGLAKRLLHSRSVSEDAERSFVSKLKLNCGAQFTSNLEGVRARVSNHARQSKPMHCFLPHTPFHANARYPQAC